MANELMVEDLEVGAVFWLGELCFSSSCVVVSVDHEGRSFTYRIFLTDELQESPFEEPHFSFKWLVSREAVVKEVRESISSSREQEKFLRAQVKGLQAAIETVTRSIAREEEFLKLVQPQEQE